MIDLMDQTEIDARFDELVLDIEDLESLEAPGFWEGLLGVAVGLAVGAGAFALGVALT
jgi:hypothetical protein